MVVTSASALIGHSGALCKARDLVFRYLPKTAPVLIHGESGTGKELVARMFQTAGGMPSSVHPFTCSLVPFISVDCATIPASMAESLLFGYERGAFTGAERPTPGIFELANGGVLYLDEIANMPLDIQQKFLRVLQEKEVRPLGSKKTLSVQFRLVCATNQDLEVMVGLGKFKLDLLQRIQVLPIYLPPLRERKEDIPLILNKINQELAPSGPTLQFSPLALEQIFEYAWPGNVRELQNLVHYLLATCDSSAVELEHLPVRIISSRARVSTTHSFSPLAVSEPIQAKPVDLPRVVAVGGASFADQMAKKEAEILTEALKLSNGNVTLAAASLKMNRSHFHWKMKQWGLVSKNGDKKT